MKKDTIKVAFNVNEAGIILSKAAIARMKELGYTGKISSAGNVWQLFGHVHSGPLSGKGKDGDSGSGKDLPRLSMLFPRQYDVGVDNNDFRPVSFAEVKTIIQHQINLKSSYV